MIDDNEMKIYPVISTIMDENTVLSSSIRHMKEAQLKLVIVAQMATTLAQLEFFWGRGDTPLTHRLFWLS